MPVAKELLAILACPVCKESVAEDGAWLVCAKCRKKYPVRDDIPVMLVDEAVDIDGGADGSSVA